MERRVLAYKNYFTDFIYSIDQSGAKKVFFIFDADSIVMLFNGFQKKSQKTPRKEINLAKKIRNEYINEKGK